jgi:hypothetical protein
VYDPDDTHAYPRTKIGNGIDIVKDLPFLLDDDTDLVYVGSTKW